MSRVLVTGAAGFIGSHVCEALLERGEEVTGLDNFDPFYPRALKEENLAGVRRRGGFRFVEGDITRDALPLDGIAAVLHLAAKTGVRSSVEDPTAYVAVNVLGTARVLEAARAAGVRRIVLGSSSSIYGDATPRPFVEDAPAVEPVSPYAASKRAAELVAHVFAHLHEMRIVCLRFFTVYGPRQRPDLAVHRFTDQIARDEPVRAYGDGSSEREYTYITDAVAGVLAALDWTARPGARACVAINLGGGEQVTLDRLIALIARAYAREARVERAPDQPGDVRHTAADLERACRELGYRPRVGIEEGIRHFVGWYEARHGRQF
jgi:UDP-glucuronate 4-epimerase